MRTLSSLLTSDRHRKLTSWNAILYCKLHIYFWGRPKSVLMGAGAAAVAGSSRVLAGWFSARHLTSSQHLGEMAIAGCVQYVNGCNSCSFVPSRPLPTTLTLK